MGGIIMTLTNNAEWETYKQSFGYGVISHTVRKGKTILSNPPYPCQVRTETKRSLTDRDKIFVIHEVLNG